jgi:hypothetical protein
MTSRNADINCSVLSGWHVTLKRRTIIGLALPFGKFSSDRPDFGSQGNSSVLFACHHLYAARLDLDQTLEPSPESARISSVVN